MKNNIAIVMVVISAIVIFNALFKKNESFFGLRKVFKSHLSLFKDCPSQYFVFYGLPFAFAIGLSILYIPDEQFYSELNVLIGIFLTILLAILTILTNKQFDNAKDTNQKERVKNVVAETVNSIIFASLLCIFLLLYGLTMRVVNSIVVVDLIKCIFSAFAYYLFTVILLTLLMIVKRISRIILFDLNVEKEEQK